MKHPYFDLDEQDTFQEYNEDSANEVRDYVANQKTFKKEFYIDTLKEVHKKYFKNKDHFEDIILSPLPFLKIQTPIPFHEIYDEAARLLPFFVSHRANAYNWKSLCLWGLSHAHTGVPEDYGMIESDELENEYMDWTDMSKFCPTTTQWLKNDFGFRNFTRVRFMLLAPGGYIAPHNDHERRELVAINIALNMPEKCCFVVDKYGSIPIDPGDIFLFNNSYDHSLLNESSMPRIHMIIYGGRQSDWWKKRIVSSLIHAYNVYVK
jgi:DNA-dependent RNA polymerase auxiliary subunit epsilon